jgi:hypothetical protein
VNGYTPDIKHLKNDVVVIPTNKGNHRLAASSVLGNNYGNKNKCSLVRPQIKSFGYCWVDENVEKGIDTTKERRWVHEVIQQWAKCGGIKIAEEKTCRQGPDFVTFHVGNYHPVLHPKVDTTTCTIQGFDIYMDFYTFGVNIEWFKSTEKFRQSSIQMYALHEFGHFLGFDHEHNRSDREQCGYEIDKTSIGPDAWYGTDAITQQYDTDSIMNYCRPQLFFKPYLSAIDKEGIKLKYGGGNQKECDAVTKPTKWGPEDDVDEETLNALNGDGSSSGNTGNKPKPIPIPEVCADQTPECANLVQSCGDEPMKYWCPKTCQFC